jgi:hypothetical protein
MLIPLTRYVWSGRGALLNQLYSVSEKVKKNVVVQPLKSSHPDALETGALLCDFPSFSVGLVSHCVREIVPL